MVGHYFGPSPAEILGILDDAPAYDLNQAAAYVLSVAEDRKAVEFAKLSAVAMYGGGGDVPETAAQQHIHSRFEEFCK